MSLIVCEPKKEEKNRKDVYQLEIREIKFSPKWKKIK